MQSKKGQVLFLVGVFLFATISWCESGTFRDLLGEESDLVFVEKYLKLSNPERQKVDAHFREEFLFFESAERFNQVVIRDGISLINKDLEKWLRSAVEETKDTKNPKSKIEDIWEVELTSKPIATYLKIIRTECIATKARKKSALLDGFLIKEVWAQSNNKNLRQKTWIDDLRENICFIDHPFVQERFCQKTVEEEAAQKVEVKKPVMSASPLEPDASVKGEWVTCIRNLELKVGIRSTATEKSEITIDKTDTKAFIDGFRYTLLQKKAWLALESLHIMKSGLSKKKQDEMIEAISGKISDWRLPINSDLLYKRQKMTLYLNRIKAVSLEDPLREVCGILDGFYLRHKEIPTKDFKTQCKSLNSANANLEPKKSEVEKVLEGASKAENTLLSKQSSEFSFALELSKICKTKDARGCERVGEFQIAENQFRAAFSGLQYFPGLFNMRMSAEKRRGLSDFDLDLEAAKIVIAAADKGEGLQLKSELTNLRLVKLQLSHAEEILKNISLDIGEMMTARDRMLALIETQSVAAEALRKAIEERLQ